MLPADLAEPEPEPKAEPVDPAALAEPEPPEAIEVTIVGTRLNQTAGSAHVLRNKQLERFEYDDAHSILLQVPGVYVRQEDGVGLRPNIGLRGANPDRSKKVTLMEDGVLFGPAPYSAPAAYFFPLMTRITGVRVIKGPSAVAHGPQTVGGAIDLSSRVIPSGPPTGALDLSAGEYGYGKAHGYFGASTEQFGYLVEGVHLRNSGFYELPSGADTGSRRNEWVIRTSYTPDPDARDQHSFDLKLSYSDEHSNESYLGLTDEDFHDNPYRRYPAAALDEMINHRVAGVLTHTFEASGADLKIKTQLYRHDFARTWSKLNRFAGTHLSSVLRDPDDLENLAYYEVLTGAADSSSGADTLLIGPNARTYVSQGVQSVLGLRATTGPLDHRIELGARLHYDSIERKHSEDGFLMSGGVPMHDGSPTVVTTLGEASTLALATHATVASTWRALTLTPGVRLEVIHSEARDDLADTDSDRLAVAVLPGVGAYYALTEELGVLAGVHRGFSPPPPGSSDAVEPEYSVNYEAGTRFTLGQLRLEAIGFYNDYSNLTDVCTFSSGCLNEDLDRQFDAGRARILGLELFGAHDLRLGPLMLPMTLAYTFSRGEFLTSFQSQDPIYGNVIRGDDIPYIPMHQLSATLGVEVKRGGAAVAVNYVAPMREEPGDEPLDQAWTTDEQLWVDLQAHVRIIDALTGYASVRNLFGAENIVARRPFGARANAPRWIQIGIKGQL